MASTSELQQRAMDYAADHPGHSIFPGPLFNAVIFYIEDIQSAGFVFYGKSPHLGKKMVVSRNAEVLTQS